ncbi:hypothetical protein SOJ65_12950 [Pseudomonas aeruginosa]|uniref:hypothetical protein n=1 Tax=Pseudomonas aeruginosa TaxID=287 RepID=UPI00255496D0|nr:hypothetical protein [Pseudomonas aeruginosa]MDY1051965.1 hypothetical protein [Pseudomonas aeruginosa]MEC5849581.1 hypothetical protein [Pseudomonas aeruginosa]
MKPMIQAHLVERDQFGFWTHPNYPDLADNCSSSEAQETLRRLGLELQNVFMESDAPRLYDSARSDQRYSEWIPTRPEGAGWFVLSIHDTDNGPVCQYVRPLGEHLSPIDLDAAAEQHERLLSEACAKALNQRDVALARVASLESKLAELEKPKPAAPALAALPPFAEKVLAKLHRFYDCVSDFESGGVDIGRHWLDLLTQLGLLNRVQRSPALWEITQQGEDLLGTSQPSPAPELAERGTQHRFSTTEQTCRHDFAGVWWNDNGETKTGRECRHCGFFVADVTKAQAEQAEAERLDWSSALLDVAVLQEALTSRDSDERMKNMDAGEVIRRAFGKLKEIRAQHERIVGELRAENERLANDRDRANQFANGAALEINAALARVEQQERTISGMNEAHAKLAGLYEAAQAQHSVPEWTSSKPAVEGAYWVRGNGLVEPFVVLVKLDQGELWCNLHMRNTDTNFGYGYAVDDLSSEFEWCGPLAAATGRSVPQAWLDVQAERRRQVEAENWTPEHDDQHSDGQMAQAAGCYALHAGGIGTDWPGGIRNGSALFWPWDEEWWKPKSARENLVRAGALVLAEIERLDRSATEQGSTCCKGSA